MKNSTFFLHFRSLGKNTTTISISTQDSQRGAKKEKKIKKRGENPAEQSLPLSLV